MPNIFIESLNHPQKQPIPLLFFKKATRQIFQKIYSEEALLPNLTEVKLMEVLETLSFYTDVLLQICCTFQLRVFQEHLSVCFSIHISTFYHFAPYSFQLYKNWAFSQVFSKHFEKICRAPILNSTFQGIFLKKCSSKHRKITIICLSDFLQVCFIIS